MRPEQVASRQALTPEVVALGEPSLLEQSGPSRGRSRRLLGDRRAWVVWPVR